MPEPSAPEPRRRRAALAGALVLGTVFMLALWLMAAAGTITIVLAGTALAGAIIALAAVSEVAATILEAIGGAILAVLAAIGLLIVAIVDSILN